jgi:hypothetical protein
MIVFNICQIKIGRIGRAGHEIADAQQLSHIPQLGETIAVTSGRGLKRPTPAADDARQHAGARRPTIVLCLAATKGHDDGHVSIGVEGVTER